MRCCLQEMKGEVEAAQPTRCPSSLGGEPGLPVSCQHLTESSREREFWCSCPSLVVLQQELGAAAIHLWPQSEPGPLLGMGNNLGCRARHHQDACLVLLPPLPLSQGLPVSLRGCWHLAQPGTWLPPDTIFINGKPSLLPGAVAWLG